MASVDFQDFIDEVVEKNDIVDIISEYTKPKRMGNRYAALCPLHNDKKSPSLSISPEKQVFHCFGCGVGGNVIHFVMAAEHLDFMDAVKLLADRAKIPVPEFKNSNGKSKDIADKKQLIYKINADAARYFYSNLAGEKGAEALKYLKNRGIKNSTIKMFGLGYAPEGWDNLLLYLKNKGYKEHDIYEAGLVKIRDNGSYYDSFYDGRIMYPIINVQGNIIGFGGRIMTENSNTGKYLNSPETIVFKKKENLFGLNLAKSDNSGSLLLMEGYMDVISLHQAGINNAVASLGTAFTDEQAKLVKRYGGKAVLCYDSDEAGKKATLRAGEILSKNGIKAKVLTVTDGKDPDEFVRNKGGDLFKVLIENAKPLIEYRIDEIQKEYTGDLLNKDEFASPEQRIEFTERAAAVLADIKSPVEYEIYLKRVEEKSGVSANALNSVVEAIRKNLDLSEERRLQQLERRKQNELNRTNIDVRLFNAEQLVLSLLCERDVYKIALENGMSEENFSDPMHRELAEIIFKQYENNDVVNINEILEMFEPEKRGRI
ncbi:MAG: DNA primase, partial [Monoglobaceae bacterium]